MILSCFLVRSQNMALENEVGLIGGMYYQISQAEAVEQGFLLGVNAKDKYYFGAIYQIGQKGHPFFGTSFTYSCTKRLPHITAGFNIKSAFIENKYLYVEPAVYIDWSVLDSDNFRALGSIGFIQKSFSFNIGLIYGNFGKKFWENKH